MYLFLYFHCNVETLNHFFPHLTCFQIASRSVEVHWVFGGSNGTEDVSTPPPRIIEGEQIKQWDIFVSLQIDFIDPKSKVCHLIFKVFYSKFDFANYTYDICENLTTGGIQTRPKTIENDELNLGTEWAHILSRHLSLMCCTLFSCRCRLFSWVFFGLGARL